MKGGRVSSWILIISSMLFFILSVKGQLRPDYYATTCPNAEAIARNVVAANIANVPALSAGLLRLFFHDCAVQGCDASIMLDADPKQGSTSELESPSNIGIGGINVIDDIKVALEEACPNTISCADIIVLAGRDAVNIAGGPRIIVPLGRKDTLQDTSSELASNQIPLATINLNGFLQFFGSMGMTIQESVAILGAHTLGVGHCVNIVNRLYPTRESNLDVIFWSSLATQCPPFFNSATVIPNDLTPFLFDDQYFFKSTNGRGLFTVDAEVANDSRTGPIMQFYATNQNTFFQEFSNAFVKLSSNGVLIDGQGEVRSNCHIFN